MSAVTLEGSGPASSAGLLLEWGGVGAAASGGTGNLLLAAALTGKGTAASSGSSWQTALRVPTSTALRATVYTYPNLVTPDGIQPTWVSASFQDVLGDTGSGSVTYPNDEAVPGVNKMIQFSVYGIVAKTILVSPYDRTAVATDEEAAELTTVSGIDAQLDELAKARVWPPNGVDRLPVCEDRVGDYTDPNCYDDSSWSPANALWTVGTAKLFWDIDHPDNPIVFPDETAYLLAAPGDTTTSAPLGTRWLRQTITVPATRDYVIYTGFDDTGEIHIDGAPIVSIDANQNFTQNNYTTVSLSAGEHVVAMRLQNMPWADPVGNACGAAFAIYIPGYPPQLVAHSDATAKVVVQEDAPGMTVGRFMRCLLFEAVVNGFLQPFVGGPVVTWSDARDSNGNLWDVVVPSTKVSTDLLTVFTKDLAPYVELWAEPGAWLLHAVQKGAKGGSSGVTLTTGTNITGLSQKGEMLTPSGDLQALVRWGGGWTTVGTGDHEVFLDLGALNDRAEVERVAQDQLDEFGRQREQITVAYEPSSNSEIPYLTAALQTGATVTVPDSTDTPTAARVQTITCIEDNNTERLQISLTLDDVVLDPQERINLQLKKMVF